MKYKQEYEMAWLKYTILRRAICTRCHAEDLKNLNYTRESLEKLSYEIEGKTMEELKEIHRHWIGYK